jgi:hypothetical protein
LHPFREFVTFISSPPMVWLEACHTNEKIKSSCCIYRAVGTAQPTVQARYVVLSITALDWKKRIHLHLDIFSICHFYWNRSTQLRVALAVLDSTLNACSRRVRCVHWIYTPTLFGIKYTP